MASLARHLKLLTCSAAALAAATLFGIVAIAMLTAAAFVWLSQQYDPITALLAIGLAFLAVSGSCAIVAYVVAQKRHAEKVEPVRRQLATLEPDLLAAGLDVIRVVGGRKAASIAAGAVVVYWMFFRDGAAERGHRR